MRPAATRGHRESAVNRELESVFGRSLGWGAHDSPQQQHTQMLKNSLHRIHKQQHKHTIMKRSKNRVTCSLRMHRRRRESATHRTSRASHTPCGACACVRRAVPEIYNARNCYIMHACVHRTCVVNFGTVLVDHPRAAADS